MTTAVKAIQARLGGSISAGSADRTSISEPVLLLNGDEPGPINNLSVPSAVSPTYAPPGAALVSVTVLGESQSPDELEAAVRRQLRGWFREVVDTWRHLQTYQIAHALPDQSPPTPRYPALRKGAQAGIYFCGDYLENGSLNGTLLSRRRAAEAIIASAIR